MLVSAKAIGKILLLPSCKIICYDTAVWSDVVSTTIDSQAFIPICALHFGISIVQ